MADFFDPIISSQVNDYLANQQATADQTVQDPYAPGLTLNEIDGGYLTPPEAPQLPSPTVALNTLPEGTSEGMSVGRRGVNKEALAADMQGGEAARVERQIFNDSAAEGEAAYDPLLRQMGRTQAAANQAAQDVGEAASNEALAEARSFDEQARYIDRNYNQATLDFERSEQRKAQSEAQLRRAKYYQAEDAFARMSIKPKDFQLELGLSMAVDSWLALWGVKTNNTSAVLEQIRNDINVQMENIQHGREVANGFKMAYDLATQNATSKKEAADQIEAMLFKSMSYKLEGDKARAKSTTELANIKAKQADIDGHYLELQSSIESAMDQDIAKRRDDRIQLYNINVQKHLEELRLQAARAAARAKAPVGPSREDMAKLGVWNPFTDEFEGRGRDDKAALEAQKELNKDANLVGKVLQYVDEVNDVALRNPQNIEKLGVFLTGENVPNPFSSKEDQAKANNIKALYQIIFSEWGKDISGAAISAEEMKRLQNAFMPSSVINPQGSSTAAQFADLSVKKVRRMMAGRLFQATPEEIAAAPRSISGGLLGPQGQKASDYRLGPPEPAPPTRIEAKAKAAQSDPSEFSSPTKDWKGFVSEYKRGGGGQDWEQGKMPDVAKKVDEITQVIKDGESARKSGVKSESAQRKIAEAGQAESQLQEIARGSSLMAPYAKYQIDKNYKYLRTKARDVTKDEAAAEAERLRAADQQLQYDEAVRSPSYYRGR